MDGDEPAISVVVAAWAGEARLRACLDSLGDSADAEVIVATGAPAEDVRRFAALYPNASFVGAAAGSDVPQLRAIGAARARGRLVALIEDHCTVAPTWRDALCRAHAAGQHILGGSVDNGLVDSAYDWALFLCEYGYHIAPGPEGPADAVSGLNVAYDRVSLQGCRSVWRERLYEGEVNDALRPLGHTPYVASEAGVTSYLPMRLGEAMRHLFQGGQHFGQYRTTGASAAQRLFRIVTAPAVPFVLFRRIFDRVSSRDPSRLRHLWRGLVYCALLLGSWSAGEALGYVRGPLPATQPETGAEAAS